MSFCIFRSRSPSTASSSMGQDSNSKCLVVAWVQTIFIQTDFSGWWSSQIVNRNIGGIGLVSGTIGNNANAPICIRHGFKQGRNDKVWYFMLLKKLTQILPLNLEFNVLGEKRLVILKYFKQSSIWARNMPGLWKMPSTLFLSGNC